MPILRLVLLSFALLFTAVSCSLFARETIGLDAFSERMIGKNLSFFQETEQEKLTLTQALQRFETNQISRGGADAITLGLGVRPVWLKAEIQNSNDNSIYRISIETPWLDYIDAYLVQNGKILQQWHGGDAIPFMQRPMQYRYFAVDTQFPVGLVELVIRVETQGPMAIPVRLAKITDARMRDVRQGYEYGILYGIMLALGLYNFILYLFIRQAEFGLYAGYLFGFVANSLSYTGQIHAVFTPHYGALFQDWVDISLMVTYSVLGLHFARILLKTKSYAPNLDRVTFWVATVIPLGMILGAILNNLFMAMSLAFLLNTSFAFLFMILGYYAVKEGVRLALFFFVSSVTAATCICISTAAVAGLLPYNDITFKLIEVGMAFEAILLAVLLAHRFRTAQREKSIAENVARTDDLTQLFNRLGFREQADILWRNMARYQHDLSIVLIDIDKFKSINDTFGHAKGDIALQEVARRIVLTARSSDICARWGGEEFIVLLPETNLEQAKFQAERLRKAVEKEEIIANGQTVRATISIGVAGTTEGAFAEMPLADFELEKMISKADQALYDAKNSGRNQVKVYKASVSM